MNQTAMTNMTDPVFFANRFLTKSVENSEIPISEENEVENQELFSMTHRTEIMKDLDPESMDGSGDFQEIMDIVYDNKQVTIIYGKDKRNQITPAFLNGSKEIIYEYEIPSIIRKNSQEGFKELSDLNYKQAIFCFKKSENLINTYLANNGKLNNDYIIHTFLNLGICLYKYGFLEESLLLFEKCILTLKSPNRVKPQYFNNPTGLNTDYFRDLSLKIKSKKLRCSLHMQCCIILSEAEKHEEALVHGKNALKTAISLIHDTISICHHLFILNKNSNINELANNLSRSQSRIKQKEIIQKDDKIQSENILNGSNSDDDETKLNPISLKQIEEKPEENLNNDYITKILSILFELKKRMNDLNEFNNDKKEFIVNILKKNCGETLNIEEPNIRNLFSHIKNQINPIFRCNILGLMQLAPTDFLDLAKKNEISDEIKPEIVLEKITNLALSCYCISTEIRFMEEKLFEPNRIASIIEMDSEFWLGRSLETAYVFLPHDSPFVIQIISVFARMHAPSKQIIPEDEPLNDVYKLVLPMRGGIKSSFLIPLVKVKTVKDKKESLSKPNRFINDFQIKKIGQKSMRSSTNSLKAQTKDLSLTPIPKKLNSVVLLKKKRSINDIEKIYTSRLNPLKTINIGPSEKSRYLDYLSKPPNSELLSNTQPLKSSFVTKLKSKMKRSKTPKEFPSIFTKSLTTKPVTLNIGEKEKEPLRRSISSNSKQNKNEGFIRQRNNNFMNENNGIVNNNINLKNIGNVGIQINNNINVIINSKEGNTIDKNEILAETTNNIVNNKIFINKKGREGFKFKRKVKKVKNNQLNAIFGDINLIKQKKDDKMMIFPTDYIRNTEKS